ncbi:MAG: hypothetical protein EBZ77_17495, partial [Chitinophagia bacterium]|nr:hypothetical protein [Chitinophagia bacterium]
MLCDAFTSLFLAYNDCAKGFVVVPGALVAIEDDLVVPAGAAIVIQSGGALVISSGKKLVISNGASFINLGVVGNKDVVASNDSQYFQGALALELGANVVIGAAGVSGAVNESAQAGHFGSYNNAPGINTNVVPYLPDTASIGESSATVTPADCAQGFVIADGATVNLSGRITDQTGLAIIGSGAVLKLQGAAYWSIGQSNTSVINKGTIVVGPWADPSFGPQLDNMYNNIDNSNGALVVQGAFNNYPTSTLGGILAFAVGATINENGPSSWVADVDSQCTSFTSANCMLNIPDGKTIALSGGDLTPADLASGFFIAPGDSVALSDDVVVTSGSVVVEGILVINTGKTL